MRHLATVIALMCMVQTMQAQFKVSSPDGIIKVELNTHRDQKGITKFWVPTHMTIQVYNSRHLIANGEIGVDVKWHGHHYSFGKTDIDLCQTDNGLHESADTRATALQSFGDTYNRLQLGVKPGIILEVRAYNEGVAYQFRITGIADDYKILRLCDPFPNEKPIAIVGTFTGDHILPWGILNVEQLEAAIQSSKSGKIRKIKYDTPSTSTKGEGYEKDSTLRSNSSPFRLVSWRDALSSITVGASVNMYHGSAWRQMNNDYSYDVNLTYKYLYAGISYAPCNEILFVHFQHDYEPFTNVMGSIHQWKVGARLGLSLPFQQGLEIWNFTPYVATSLMRVRQHGGTAIGYHKPTLHNEYLIGPGISVQVVFASHYVWAINYDYQLFTGKLTPKGMHSVGTSIGYFF